MFHQKIALRYLKGRKKFFFSFSNLLSLMGIIIGVFSLLVVSSVMNGFDADMRNRIVGMKAEIRINDHDFEPLRNYRELTESISRQFDLKGVSPVCETELLVQNKKNLASSICYGIDLDKHEKIVDIFDKMVVGAPSQESLQEDGIILGLDMSLTLNVTVGEFVQLSSPLGTEPSPFGLLPRSKKLKVIGLFVSGLPEYDKLFSYISLENARFFLSYEDETDHLEIKTKMGDNALAVADKIALFLGDEYKVEDWSEFDANLFNAIKMEKIVMFLVLALMLIIASFNMSGNFIRLVTEKNTEIGILKALGSSEKDIMKIFLNIGLIVGILGTITGMLLALFFLLLQSEFHLLKIPVAGFPLQWLPVEIRIIDFIMVPIIVIAISFLTTLYPSKRSGKIDPIKIIRK